LDYYSHGLELLTRFLNELFNACQRGILYDDNTTSLSAAALLFYAKGLKEKDLWLIRCSPKKETPFVLTYTRITPEEKKVIHHRIFYNVEKKEYNFPVIQNLHRSSDVTSSTGNGSKRNSQKIVTSDSINRLISIIQRECNFGEGYINTKLRFMCKCDYEDVDFHHYVV